jgi:hypothetical protein
MRLPASFSDETSLQKAYTLLRIDGLCAMGLFAIMILIGRMTDITSADEMARVRYGIMTTLPLTWMTTMMGGVFVIEGRRLQLWLRAEDAPAGIHRTICRTIAIVFAIGGSGVMAASMAIAAMVSWMAVDAGILM